MPDAPTKAPPKRRLARRKPVPARLMTSEEFLDWLEPGKRADLIDGEIHLHSPVNIRHANLVNFLDHLLRLFLQATDTPGALHRETVAIRLNLRDTFMPDLEFFEPYQVAQFAEAHIPLAPRFCVEVLSLSTKRNDLGRKFIAYEAHGVEEYWLIDPMAGEHRFFRRAGQMFQEFAVAEERIGSVTIAGFWIKRAWLGPENPPKVGACLGEILKTRSRRR